MAANKLVEALWSDLPRGKYATASEVDASSMPTSIQVEGAGTMVFPLSHQDVYRLKSTPLSKVSCPQIPDFFSKVVGDLAASAMEEIEIDARGLGLDVKLHKLVVHDKGDNLVKFDSDIDTETGKGLIATMVLQVPTQLGHEGGELEVFHGEKSASFDFSGVNSCKGFFRTLFLCDCEHKLAEVKRGSGVYFVFCLVSENVKYIDDVRRVPIYLSALGTVQKLLKDFACEPMLVIPLGHTYESNRENTDVSFASLKGYDRVVAALVLSCAGFLDVHLCTLVYDLQNEYGPTRYKMCNWKALDDLKLANSYLEKRYLDKQNLVGQDSLNLFTLPGNNIGNECAAVVVWPKGGEVEVVFNRQLLYARLEEQHRHNPERTSGVLQRCMTTHKIPIISELLMFCLRHDFRDTAFTILKKWALLLVAGSDRDMVSAAIQKYGWEECYEADNLQELLEDMDAGQLSTYPQRLAENGFQDAALYLAKELVKREPEDALPHFSSILLEFCISCGLEDETWRILSVARPCFDERHLTLVVKRWGEKSFPLIEEFCRRDSKLSRPEQTRKRRRQLFLRKIAKLVWNLEREDCHDAALHFAKKLGVVDDNISLEEVYGDLDEIDAEDGLVLLLRSQEMFYETLKKVYMSPYDAQTMIRSMREAVRLSGVKRDAKATQILIELRQIAIEEEKEDIRDTLEAMFWLGDETVLQDIAKKAGDHPLIARCIAKNADYLVDKCDNAGKNWLREVLKTRIAYLSSDYIQRTIRSEEACKRDRRRRPWSIWAMQESKPLPTGTARKMERVELDILCSTLDRLML